MHRRLVKSAAAVMGAAVLFAAPMAILAPAAHAAIIEPDETMPFDPELNQPETWEEWLWEEEGIDAVCEKDDSISKPYTIPSIEDFFDVPAEEADDVEYVLAVLKGGADQDSDKDANQLYWYPEEGDQLSHEFYGNSHVILCVAETEDETTPPPSTTPPVTTPPVTGPVVETDRVADTGPAAGLGLAAGAAALIAGVGAMLFSRRRQGSHR